MDKKREDNQKVYCNQCGQAIEKRREDYLEVNKEWGYFSNKDLEIHNFCLCEKCYDEIVKGFKLPIQIKKNIEAL